MKTYAKYSKTTGNIKGTISCPENMIDLQLGDDEDYIEVGHRINDASYRIDVTTKQIVDIPEDEKPKPDYKTLRRKEYPKNNDQLELIMGYLATRDDLTPELSDMIDAIEKIKTKYPSE